ncbi:MAG TPA: hypothetical protein VF778_13310, partial [Xanthobacteraceae bacterium]
MTAHAVHRSQTHQSTGHQAAHRNAAHRATARRRRHAGVLFEIPPAAIRETVQRHPGEHDRVDLAFAWPSLTPPQADEKPDRKPPLSVANAIAAAAEPEKERLFVTIEGLNGVLPPLERLRTIYPRYVEAQASTGPDGLASLSFR